MTDQNYKELVALREKYASRGFEVLGCPSNEFGGQEPGSASDIKTFVGKYGVKFPLSEKLCVNGDGAHPLWKHLKASAPESGLLALAGSEIKWNFSKFLLDKDGKTIKRYAPTESPMSFENDIKAALP